MFGPLGVPELLFIFGLALLIFGPRKLPEIGRTLGKGMAEFRKASNELKRTINSELIQEELRESDPRQALKETLDAAKGELGEDKKAAASMEREQPSSEPEVEGASIARGQLDADSAEPEPGAGVEVSKPLADSEAVGESASESELSGEPELEGVP